MIHGVGAETPTQVLVLVAAAGLGGTGAGVVLLVCFLGGLVASNTVVALASTLGLARATRSFRLYATVSVVTAVFSLAVGGLLLLGRAGSLPALAGG
jgi:high-affinity nickel-transport protein